MSEIIVNEKQLEEMRNDITDIKVGMKEISTLLESGLIYRIEVLEEKQKQLEQEQKQKNNWFITSILGMIVKMVYDMIK